MLDAETGLVVNVSPGTSIEGVLRRALKSALVTPAPPLAKAVPQRLVVPPELLQAMQVSAGHLSWLADTALTEGIGMDDAEEIMDSLVGHREGRAQPDDLPAADDYRVLYRERRAYVEAEPWKRWTDSDWFTASLDLDGNQVELVLTPDGDDTLVVLTHRGPPSTHLDNHRAGWEEQFRHLATIVT